MRRTMLDLETYKGHARTFSSTLSFPSHRRVPNLRLSASIMGLFAFSMRSKRVLQELEPDAAEIPSDTYAKTILEIGEFGELSWTSSYSLNQSYDGESFLPASDVCHSHALSASNASTSTDDAGSDRVGTSDLPFDAPHLPSQTTATPLPPRLSSSTNADRPILDLSIDPSCFPLVPPASDSMIDAITLGLEREYHHAVILRDLSPASSNSSSASSSFSNLFDSSSQAPSTSDSECSTPDTEWSASESVWGFLSQPPSSLQP
ncbi:hypothetical protein NMY22_g13205 [Coprinellus aureogranulatus]|nr:hypothetical protein NMY22_g13205 [Coprinellus aureogranulatus]